MGWDEGGWTDFGSDAQDTFLLRALTVAAGGALIVALEPSGAGMAAAAVMTTAVVPNVVDPEPWFTNSGAWGDLKNTYDSMVSDLRGKIATVDGRWQDTAAKEFHAFATGTLEPALERLAEACSHMDSMCTQMATAVTSTIAAFLTGTASAIVAALAANASGPVSPAVKIAIFATWATFAVGVIGLLVSLVLALWASTKTLGDAHDALANMLGEKDGQINADSLKLPEPVRIVLSNPEEWEKVT